MATTTIPTDGRPDEDLIRRAPKVLLHDHLDGGLRPPTVVELAARVRLPRPADSTHGRGPGPLVPRGGRLRLAGALPRDVRSTPSRVMQTATRSVRVAARVRRGPRGRRRGLRRGPLRARAAPRRRPDPRRGRRGGARRVPRGRAARRGGRAPDPGRRAASPRCGTRPARARSPSWRCGYRDRGVVGFDIAGAEAGFPPTRHLDAFEYLRRENFHFTIHAGEAFGLPSIWEAMQWCGADRLGHGVRIIDDILVDSDGEVTLGRLAAVRARQADPAGDVPVVEPADRRGGVDRRTPDRPAAAAAVPGHRQHRQPADERDLDDPRDRRCSSSLRLRLEDLQWFTINAMKSAFIPFDHRLAIINDVIKPGYAALRCKGSTARRGAGTVLLGKVRLTGMP